MLLAKSDESPVLSFFVARLATGGPKRSKELYLRFNATGSNTDLTSNEAVLASFCYPLGPDMVETKEYGANEEYTFTLTAGDGRRFQGFCRRFLPPAPKIGSRLRHPNVLCLIAEYPWYDFYFKVLQLIEHLLKNGDQLLHSGLSQVPGDSPTGLFLTRLGQQLSLRPSPGQIIKVSLPNSDPTFGSPPGFLRRASFTLPGGDDTVELQVPFSHHNGTWNCGLSLARLLWHVPVASMLTLIASLLMERRIIVVARSRDAVSAAVQAATALLYPFRWHHIYLPLLPNTFIDYLTAPMPFMVGIPAAMLPRLKNIPMDEVTIIDLDLGTCDPLPGSARDDAQHLPWKEGLEKALTAVYTLLKSPTEHESSPVIAAVMQEYFCKLFSNLPAFIQNEHKDLLNKRVHVSADNLSGLASLSASILESPRRIFGGGKAGAANKAAASQRDPHDDVLSGYGKVFEHGLFVKSFRRNDKAWRFLRMFRHSQMYEVYVQDQLKAASERSAGTDAGTSADAGGRLHTGAGTSTGTVSRGVTYEGSDFDERANRYLERMRQKVLSRHTFSLQRRPGSQSLASQSVDSSVQAQQHMEWQSALEADHNMDDDAGPFRSRWSAMLKGHRRTDSELAVGSNRNLREGLRRNTADASSAEGRVLQEHELQQQQRVTLDPASFFDYDDCDVDYDGPFFVNSHTSASGPLSMHSSTSAGSQQVHAPSLVNLRLSSQSEQTASHSRLLASSSTASLLNSLRHEPGTALPMPGSTQEPHSRSQPSTSIATASLAGQPGHDHGASCISSHTGASSGSRETAAVGQSGVFSSAMKDIWSGAKQVFTTPPSLIERHSGRGAAGPTASSGYSPHAMEMQELRPGSKAVNSAATTEPDSMSRRISTLGEHTLLHLPRHSRGSHSGIGTTADALHAPFQQHAHVEPVEMVAGRLRQPMAPSYPLAK